MITFLYIFAACCIVFAVFTFCGVTPETMLTDILEMLRPAKKIRFQAEDIQENKRKTDLYGKIMNLRNSMEATGRGKLFPVLFICAGAFVLAGVMLALLLDNIFLVPTFAVAFGMLPFLYISKTVKSYEKATRDEMETALSVITNAYMRQDDITKAVRDTIVYIKPPLKHIFNQFLADTVINPSTKQALYQLRTKIDDQIYFEWVTTLIQCQDDRTLKENLQPVVNKITDVRVVNDEVASMIASARMEYYTILALLVANIPLMYAMNYDGFVILMTTTIGKFILGLIAAIALITYFLMRRDTKPVTYTK